MPYLFIYVHLLLIQYGSAILALFTKTEIEVVLLFYTDSVYILKATLH